MIVKRYPKGTWMKLRSGELLRSLMTARNASNADVGMAAGVGRTFISALVNGRRNSCKTTTADRIAGYFQVPTEVLFEVKTSADSGRNVKGEAA